MRSMNFSVIIRTKNEGRHIHQTLEALFSQNLADRMEVIVIDSGSTDATLELARQWNVRLIHIPPESFTYGFSLNRAICEAMGEIVVILSAHATPASPTWLDALTNPFCNPAVAGVYGRQIPHRDCNPLEAQRIRHWFPASGNLPQVLFSNANSAIRKCLWETEHFDEDLPGTEDVKWAEEMLAGGHEIRYAPEAAVYYARDESLRQVYRRAARERFALVQLGTGKAPRPVYRRLAGPVVQGGRDALMVLAADGLKGLRWAIRAIPSRAAFELGWWTGEQAARRGVSLLELSRR